MSRISHLLFLLWCLTPMQGIAQLRVATYRKSPEIPLGPVLVSSRFSDAEQEQMAAAFTNLHRSHPAAFEAAKQGWSEAQHVQTYQRVPADYLDRLMPQFGDIAELKRILAKFLTGG